MYVTDYTLSDNQKELKQHNELKEDEHPALTKFALGLSRRYDWGRNWFWSTQQSYFLSQNGVKVSRNNVMRSESKFWNMKTRTTPTCYKNTSCPSANLRRTFMIYARRCHMKISIS